MNFKKKTISKENLTHSISLGHLILPGKLFMFTFENCHTTIISSLTSYQENIVIWKEEKKPTNLRHKIICSMAFDISYIQISYTFR